MTQDWRDEAKRHPKVIALNRLLANRKNELARDKQFVIETARLQPRLEEALAKHEKHMRVFFRTFSYPIGVRLIEVKKFLENLERKQLKNLLGRYLKYVARFGTVFRLRSKRPHFRLEYLIPWGSKFHVRLVKGHFEPADGYHGDEEPFEYFFESDRLKVPSVLGKHIASGKAKFVRIDDVSWSSALSRLEYFAYYPEGLTFVLHNAEQPYLLCLIGEKVTDSIWREASRVRSALLRASFERGKAGRPTNIPRLREAIRTRNRPGLLKGNITPEKSFYSEQSYISRVGSTLRD
jgi:hypothetical protein